MKSENMHRSLVGVAAVDIPLCEIEASAIASGVSSSESCVDLCREDKGTLIFIPGRKKDVMYEVSGYRFAWWGWQP